MQRDFNRPSSFEIHTAQMKQNTKLFRRQIYLQRNMYLHSSTLNSGVALMNLLVLLVSHIRNSFHVSLICLGRGTSINMANVFRDLEAFATNELLATGCGSVASG